MEDSIIREEYDNDMQVSQAERSLEARNRARFNIPSSSNKLSEKQQQFLIKAEEQNSVNATKHQTLSSGILAEIKEYEKATINSNMVDRMEKIVVESLAQKDQIIMAQRLAELEKEIRHKDEINKIREE